jgi:hypothetical protein
MPPADLRILEVPELGSVSHFHRNRVKRKNKRTRAALLLVSSVLDTAAVSELVDQERRRVVAARAAPVDRAAELAPADNGRLRAGSFVPAVSPLSPADAADVPERARRDLRDWRSQSLPKRRAVARPEACPRRHLHRRSPSPEPPAAEPPVPQPATGPPAGVPASAPELCPALNDGLALEVLELRRTVAALEADREEKRLRLCLLESAAHLAPRVVESPVAPLLPGGVTVAQALAEKDACITQLRFEIADRSGRRLADRLRLASEFVHNSANHFAPPPSAGTTAVRALSEFRGPSPPPGGRSPSPSPPVPARPALLFSWGQGLARGASSHDQRSRLARSAAEDAVTPAGARAPSPPT